MFNSIKLCLHKIIANIVHQKIQFNLVQNFQYVSRYPIFTSYIQQYLKLLFVVCFTFYLVSNFNIPIVLLYAIRSQNV